MPEPTKQPPQRGIRTRKEESKAQTPGEPSGVSHFLGIGIDTYPHFSPLHNAVRDVRTIAELLIEQYDLEQPNCQLVLNEAATRAGIIKSLEHLCDQVAEEDKLIIYYSGHGSMKRERGFWIPVDARPEQSASFLRNSTIRDFLADLPCRHALLISDACFSGSLFVEGAFRSEIVDVELGQRKSRWALSSGRADQLVADGKPGSHSPFAASILYELTQNELPTLRVSSLADRVTTITRSNYDQLPRSGALQGVGDRGGQYIFRRKGNTPTPKSQVPFIQDITFVSEPEEIQHIRTGLLETYQNRINSKMAGRYPINLELTYSTEGTQTKAAIYDNRTVEATDIQEEIIDVFDRHRGRLLIIGAPGVGKTTLLLQLALKLLTRVERQIPIIVNIATWQERFKSIEEWLTELLPQMGFSKKLVQELLQNERLLPLFDGLDELAEEQRAACLTAIGNYGSKHEARYVICSRIEEYKQTADAPVYCQIAVKPLTLDQIRIGLEAAADSPESRGILDAIDRDPLFAQAIQVPFYFNTAQLLFASGKVWEDFNFQGRNIKEREEEITSRFTEHATNKLKDHSSDRIHHWLSFLANGMNQHGLVSFELVDLQYSWSNWTNYQRILIRGREGLVFGLLFGLVFGLLFGLVVGLVGGPSLGLSAGLVGGLHIGLVFGPVGLTFCILIEILQHQSHNELKDSIYILIFTIVNTLIVGLVGSLIVGLVGSLIAGLVLGLVLGLIGGLIGYYTKKIFICLFITLMFCLVVSLLFNLSVELSSVEVDLGVSLSGRPVRDLVGSLIFGLVVVLVIGLGGSLYIALPKKSIVISTQEISRWNRKISLKRFVKYIMRTLYFNLAVSLVVGLVVGLAVSPVDSLAAGLILGLVVSLIVGLVLGLVLGLVIGGLEQLLSSQTYLKIVHPYQRFRAALWKLDLSILRHFLLRYALYRKGFIPKRFVRFLQESVANDILETDGGTWRFRHRILQDYFAELWWRPEIQKSLSNLPEPPVGPKNKQED